MTDTAELAPVSPDWREQTIGFVMTCAALAVLVALAAALGSQGRLIALGLVACATTVVVRAIRIAPLGRPRPPRAEVAEMPQVRDEPPTQIPVLADHCVICGRPLTNVVSRIARVGSTCIQMYGPRPAWKHNKDHDLWPTELAAARAQQAEDQVKLNRDFETASAEHAIALEEWEHWRTSDAGRERARSAWRAVARAAIAVMAAVVALVVTI